MNKPLNKMAVQATINGESKAFLCSPGQVLAEVLRDELELIGTKIGCNRGECGACTVLVDDVATYACSVLTHSMKNTRIETVEGLESPNGDLHPVQQAFVEELSPQYGYCTPGQVMSAIALLANNPRPTKAEAAQAMSGNLCRCGAYEHYLNGVLRASGQIA